MTDTYWHYEDKNKAEIEAYLEKYGNEGNLEENQNDSPTVREFLELSKNYPQITYTGYVIEKPRDDYRVSIDGFSISKLTADEALDMLETYAYADSVGHEKQADGTYTVSAWWD